MLDISAQKHAEAEVNRYVAQLKSAFLQTVEVATTIAQMRDPYTANHAKRVAQMLVEFGRELGWDTQRIEGLRIGGFLHDIGTITIPAEIIVKPGRLNPVEMKLIRTHPSAGFDILKIVDFPWPVAQMTLQHHERLDGSGYPAGLRGDDIVPEARLLAVADVVEAMCSHRPYRPALGIEKALEEVESGRGTLYGEEAVDACLRVFRERGYALPPE
ncbi:MAG: HD-GYP domain-containing protein [Gammaproteobacteria bacterium]|nr:HD-GYP domain-containing protein [Gammaproteobacteria bacterium]